MQGAPWQGLFYGFVLQAMLAVGGLIFAIESPDALTKVVAWIVVVLATRAAYRTIRRASRQGDDRTRMTGRWWFWG